MASNPDKIRNQFNEMVSDLIEIKSNVQSNRDDMQLENNIINELIDEQIEVIITTCQSIENYLLNYVEEVQDYD